MLIVTTKQRLVLLDLDQTTYLTIEPFVIAHNLEYGTRWTTSMFRNYDFSGIPGYSKKEVHDHYMQFLANNIHQLPLRHHFLETLVTLAPTHTFAVLSARPEHQIEVTKTLVEEHAGGHIKEYFFSAKLGRTKAQMCAELKPHALVEDKPEDVIECSEQTLLLMMDAMWNRHVEESDSIIRIHGYQDLPAHLL